MLDAAGLCKSYPTRSGELTVLTGVDLRLSAGQSLAIMGPSGSGKSTLLNILGLLESPSAGHYRLEDQDALSLSESQRASMRNSRIGFVFQDHHLLPQCNVVENVLVPTLVGPRDAAATERATLLLERVGLTGRLSHRPAELSGGERQRVAIARALIRNPVLLIADEPTGNLDAGSAGQVMDLLQGLQQQQNMMLIVVTHSDSIAGRFARRARLVSGRLTEMNGS